MIQKHITRLSCMQCLPFGTADKLYRMTKASPDLLSYANGWRGKQLTGLFIHSFRMSGLCLRHWNAALARQRCCRHYYSSVQSKRMLCWYSEVNWFCLCVHTVDHPVKRRVSQQFFYQIFWCRYWVCAPESVHAHAQTYSQAKVKKEEDIEGHIDLQRKVFVEVLAGFYRTGRKKKNQHY